MEWLWRGLRGCFLYLSTQKQFPDCNHQNVSTFNIAVKVFHYIEILSAQLLLRPAPSYRARCTNENTAPPSWSGTAVNAVTQIAYFPRCAGGGRLDSSVVQSENHSMTTSSILSSIFGHHLCIFETILNPRLLNRLYDVNESPWTPVKNGVTWSFTCKAYHSGVFWDHTTVAQKLEDSTSSGLHT